jgi:ethanolaminephosphotransferase
VVDSYGEVTELIVCRYQKNQRTFKHHVSLLLLFALHRVTQRWNQTGQKYAGAPDIVHEFKGRLAPLLWILILSTYATVAARLAYHLFRDLKVPSLISSTIAVALCVPTMAFKLGFTASDAPELLAWLGQAPTALFQSIPLVGTARTAFLVLGVMAAWVTASSTLFTRSGHQRKQPLPAVHDILTLLLITQTRAHNIPLYLFFVLQHNSLRRLDLTTTQATLSTILLAHVSFFALGNSNAISSIDLSNGYNGVSGYNVAAVGILVFISNWAGPIWWSAAGIKLLAERWKLQSNGNGATSRANSGRSWISKEHEHLSRPPSAKSRQLPTDHRRFSSLFSYIAIWTIFTAGSLLAVMLSCTILRTHLFIWTVFSPKYLYSMAWTLGFQLLVVVGLSSALWKVAVG